MNRVLFTVALVASLMVPVAHADVLRGHVSGLGRPDSRVDLYLKFFASESAERLLAERFITGVSLRDGHFEVFFEHTSLPSSAQFIEIALRPSERHYAAYSSVPPRRHLARMRTGYRVAATVQSPESARSVGR